MRYLFLLWFIALTCGLNIRKTTTSEGPEPTPSTIIDFLSADVQYSYFLRHLQRHGLIPQVNKLRNVTLFAPVNLAFVDAELAQHDNVDNLLRYFADQRLRVGYLGLQDVIADSLYSSRSGCPFPLKISVSGANPQQEYKVNDFAEILDFDGYAKHQLSFVHGIGRLLPLQPSICEVMMDNSTDSLNGYKLSFMKQLFQLVFSPSYDKWLPQNCTTFLANVSTIILPTDDYIRSSMLVLQQKYYTALFHGIQNVSLRPKRDAVREIKIDALNLLLNLLFTETVGGINGTNKTQSAVSGTKYKISLNPSNQLVLNHKISSAANSTSLTAQDGLIHIFDAEGNTSNFFEVTKSPVAEMIPQKALYALHFSSFVKEIRFRKLGYLIDGSTTNQTIILDSSDRDDVPEDDDLAFANGVKISSFSNRQSMLYRFLSGSVDMSMELGPDSTNFHRLLDSRLCLKKRIGSCFKVKLSGTWGTDGASTTFNDDIRTDSTPIRAAGDNYIYIGDKDLLTPSSFKHTIADLISDGVVKRHLDHIKIDKEACLATLDYLNEFNLFLLDENYKGYSVFLPCGNTVWDNGRDSREQDFGSWKGLGLVLRYLEAHPKVFKNILKGLFIEDTIYSDFGLDDAKELFRVAKTLKGDSVNVSERYQEGDFNHLIKLNETTLSVPLNSDVLFNQGVVHITSKLLLPEDFHISFLDLIKTTDEPAYGHFSFLKLIEAYPELYKALGLDGESSSDYSLLVPSPDLLKNFNITTDYRRLWDFMELHLIQNSEVEALLSCMRPYAPYQTPLNNSYTVHTNRSNGIFTCNRNPVTGKTYLSLQNTVKTLGYNSDRQVRIVTHGCTDSSNASCVFLLDKPLSLAWFDTPDNFLHIHIGWISVGIGIIIGVILFGFIATTIVVCLANTKSKKPPSHLTSTDSIFAATEPTYMRVTSDDDMNGTTYDYGYETDDDMMRQEHEQLLPSRVGRKRTQGTYGATQPSGPTAPRTIKGKGLISTMNRERNLPLNI